LSAVLHRDLNSSLRVATHGEGVWLFDAQGRRYLDASGGAAVSSLGHAHPVVVDAIGRQLAKLEFAHTSFFTNEPSEKLAQRLIEQTPEGFGAGRVAFLAGGSEAVEAALKLARQYFVEKGEKERTRFIARRMSYHGNTLGALAVGGHLGRRAIYQPMLMDTSLVAPCHAYRFREPGENDEQYVGRLAMELDREIERLGSESVAAFILEPVAGATLGAVPPIAGYLKQIREVCDRHGVLLIADEVMCGMGRCGNFFVSGQEHVTPDLIVIAKGLGAGYQPIGALLARESVVAAIASGSGMLAHGHTYMGHPIACAAALAVLECLVDHGLLQMVNERAAVLQARLHEAFADHPNIGDIRGRGLLWGLEVVADRATRAPFPASLRLSRSIKAAAQERGLICYPGSGTADGINGDHILLAPPFIISPSEIDQLVEKLAESLAAVSRSGSS
jgi:adenosylmethionine-8-amino-7-oxononanoate aminotransferase